MHAVTRGPAQPRTAPPGPCAAVLSRLEGLEAPEMTLVELVMRITVSGSAPAPEVCDVTVSGGSATVASHRGPHDGVGARDPDVHLAMSHVDFEDWRHGRTGLLDCLVGGASVTGHWLDLLCAHGLSQLPSVQRALCADPRPT